MVPRIVTKPSTAEYSLEYHRITGVRLSQNLEVRRRYRLLTSEDLKPWKPEGSYFPDPPRGVLDMR